jgi:hypothetical protein
LPPVGETRIDGLVGRPIVDVLDLGFFVGPSP